MKKLIKIIAITILAAMLFTVIPVYAADGTKTMEDEIIRLFNNARVSAGMNALEQDGKLTELAQMKAKEMAAKLLEMPEFPKGIKQFMKDNGAESKVQNYYFASGKKTTGEIVELWKKQIGFDRDTWAREKTTHIGIGIAKGADGKIYYVCIVNKPFGDKEKTALEDEVIRLLNAERKKQGLTLLAKNDDLTAAARMKAQDMADNNYCAHQSPTYGSPASMVKKYVKSVIYGGENVASGQSTAKEVFTDWKNSPSHKAIMFKKSADCAGIGVALDSKGNLVW
jgi:uncharacterized protein YkwD